MARKPIITHGKINGRATVNVKINILDSRTNHSSRLKKSKRGRYMHYTPAPSTVDHITDLKLGWTVRWRTATGNKSCPIWG